MMVRRHRVNALGALLLTPQAAELVISSRKMATSEAIAASTPDR
jgi:hypothetical protein